ncbi:unnamed protein product, partial [Timema podura]|nr:unnamed protein product [Timema podura]
PDGGCPVDQVLVTPHGVCACPGASLVFRVASCFVLAPLLNSSAYVVSNARENLHLVQWLDGLTRYYRARLDFRRRGDWGSILVGCTEGRGGAEYRNLSKSVAKVAKVLGEQRHKLHEHRGHSEEVELCVKIISDIMELLFRTDIGPTLHDITEMMLTVLRTVIQTTIAMDRESPLVGNLVAVMLAIFRQMTAHHFEKYISHFSTTMDLLDFLMEILLVFKDLVSRPVFSRDWCQMIMLQNSVILKSLRFFSHTIRDYFFQPFEIQAWNNFFHCAIAFLTQPSLQLETFSQNKRNRIVARYKDMRRETSFEIRAMWRATIPIFFDMMQCEFYSSRLSGEGFGDTKRDTTHIKAHFAEFENEMIAKLDILVEGGRGDEHYKDLFWEIMMNLCEKHSTMREQVRNTPQRGNRYGTLHNEGTGTEHSTTREQVRNTPQRGNRYGTLHNEGTGTEHSTTREQVRNTPQRGNRYGTLHNEGTGTEHSTTREQVRNTPQRGNRYGTLHNEGTGTEHSTTREQVRNTPQRGNRYGTLHNEGAGTEHSTMREQVRNTPQRGSRYGALHNEGAGTGHSTMREQVWGTPQQENMYGALHNKRTCTEHSTMGEQGIKFVKTVTRLMERLLEYRCIITDENKENRMSCTVNLLDFYSEINRKEMYIRYVNKLCDLHLECDNYTEAAYTLKLHSKLLNWSDTALPPLLKSNKFPHCQTHRELKEALYYHIMDYFDKGKMWECALTVCKELVTQYEEEIFDYIQLSSLLKRMSQFYDSIMKQIRPEPEYFRVAFYGRGFPAFLQNKEVVLRGSHSSLMSSDGMKPRSGNLVVTINFLERAAITSLSSGSNVKSDPSHVRLLQVFVYRGKEYERLSDFCSRTLNQLPNAELMSKLTPPGEDVTESQHQCILAHFRDPVPTFVRDQSRQDLLRENHPHCARPELNLDLPVFGSPVSCESGTLDNAAIKVCVFHSSFMQSCSDVQINKVDPLMDERKQRLSGKPVSDQILRYHRVNDVQKFRFSRPFHRRDPGVTGDADNEFASLWLERTVLVTSYPLPGILRWFPVTSADTYQVSPLRNAIETMEGSNRTLRDLIVAHRSDPSLQLNPLSMKINGIVDAAVMGGITNYEKAFFQPEYAETHSDEAASINKLKDLIASQIPLLEVAIQLHRQRAPVSLGPFQQRLEECFSDMQTHVEHNYGKKSTDLKLDTPHSVTMRRQFSGVTGNLDHRLSEVSLASSEVPFITLQYPPVPSTILQYPPTSSSTLQSPQISSSTLRAPLISWFSRVRVGNSKSRCACLVLHVGCYRGNRSRVSSLTRSQVATLKNFATNFNFANLNANATLGR